MLRKRLVKKKIENISERRDRATTTAIAADPGRGPERAKERTRARVIAPLAVVVAAGRCPSRRGRTNRPRG